MLIQIDTSKEMTRIDYIEFVRKTRQLTLTAPRISQLVKEGKLQERVYPSLGNLRLIVLNDEEQQLQAMFQTGEPIHNYSYKELGNYFGRLLLELTTNLEQSHKQVGERNKSNEQLRTALLETEELLQTARAEVLELSRKGEELAQANRSIQQELTNRDETIRTMQAVIESLQTNFAEVNEQLLLERNTGIHLLEIKEMLQSRPRKTTKPAAAAGKGRSNKKPKPQ